MKRNLRFLIYVFLSMPFMAKSQCTTTNATTCVCPPGGGTDCDLLPDISIARLPLTQSSNYTEYPQVCNPPCSGNDGRLRLGVSTPIIGYGPLETRGTPTYVCGTDTVTVANVSLIPTACPVTGLPPRQLIDQRIYHKSGGTMTYRDRPAGTMTYHPTHGHQHVDDWGMYTLRTNNGDPNPVNWPILGTGTKLGFCLLDIGSCQGSPGYCTDTNGTVLNNTNIPNYGLGGGAYSCSNTVQGISNGYMDTYSQGLDGMWINLPAGLCNGEYWVVVQIDPHNYFVETNENNNVVAVPITLTKQSTAPAISAGGPTTFCPGGSVVLTASSGSTNYLWSTGATTQSITVSSTGNYTVSSSCGSTVSTSSPVSVQVTPVSVTATATPSSVSCNGDTVRLTAAASSVGVQNIPVTFTTNTQLFIPDYPAAAVNSPIVVSGINPSALNSTSVVSVTLNLNHTYDSDLAIQLVSPSGNTMYLSNREGGGNDNFVNTVFSMSATTPIVSGTPPFTGTFRPDGDFATLTGNANGTWNLRVQDLAGVDTGRILNWSITINNQVPETFSYSWTSTPPGLNSTLQNPSVVPSVSTTYQVTSTSNATGCTGTMSLPVTVPAPIIINDFNPLSGFAGTQVTINGSGFTGVSDVIIAGNSASSFTVVSPTSIRAIVPNALLPATGTICVRTAGGCVKCSNTNFNLLTSVTLNLKTYFQGYYVGNGNMNPVADRIAHPSLCDTVTVQLHSSSAPYGLIASAKGTVNTNGNGTFTFPGAIKGSSYFIVIRQKNTLETWSKNPVLFNEVVNFDFTTP